MKPHAAIALATCLLAAACSSSYTLTDYATDVETIVYEMNGRIDAADAGFAGNPTLEEIQGYATERIDARREFIDRLSSLAPPREVEELHTTALAVMTRLTEAESEVAALVADAETVREASTAWDSPAGLAAREADEEAIAMCEAAQSQMDATGRRQPVAGLLWVPTELTEIVQVAFRCNAEER